jgi:hypothetical protein
MRTRKRCRVGGRQDGDRRKDHGRSAEGGDLLRKGSRLPRRARHQDADVRERT